MPIERLTKLPNNPPNGPIILIQVACSKMVIRSCSWSISGNDNTITLNTSRLRAVVQKSAPIYPSQVLEGDKIISLCLPNNFPQQYAVMSFTATNIIYEIKSIGNSAISTWPMVSSPPEMIILNMSWMMKLIESLWSPDSVNSNENKSSDTIIKETNLYISWPKCDVNIRDANKATAINYANFWFCVETCRPAISNATNT